MSGSNWSMFDFTVGDTYESTGLGIVTYEGLDTYMNEVTLVFTSEKYGTHYWLPEALNKRLKPKGEQDAV